MRRLLLFVLILVGAARPAVAGLIANYRNADDGSTLKVEVSEQGSRLEYSNQPFRLILRNTEAYIVYKTSPEVVLRVSDAEKVFEEFRPNVKIESSVIDRVKLVERGTATIAGYTGRAYHIQTSDGVSSRPALVVSNDAKLKGVGEPLARQFDFSITTVRLSGRPVPPNILLLRQFIGNGTALAFAGYRLESVTSGDVDAKRLELPAEPVSIEQLRQNAELALKPRQ